jgi:hypothetical protein
MGDYKVMIKDGTLGINMVGLAKKALNYAAKLVPNRFKEVLGRGPAASSPGDPPNTQTGTLQESVFTEPSGLSFGIGFGAEYSDFLETGTSRMASRPFMDQLKNAVEDDLTSQLDRLIEDLI